MGLSTSSVSSPPSSRAAYNKQHRLSLVCFCQAMCLVHQFENGRFPPEGHSHCPKKKLTFSPMNRKLWVMQLIYNFIIDPHFQVENIFCETVITLMMVIYCFLWNSPTLIMLLLAPRETSTSTMMALGWTRRVHKHSKEEYWENW